METTSQFEWPSPPNLSLAAKSGGARAFLNSACVINMRNDMMLMGRFVSIDVDEHCVEYIPHRSQTPASIAFSEIQSVSLTEKVSLGTAAEEIGEVDEGEEAAEPLPTPQSFTINFDSGPPMTIETYGVVETEYGIYLYPTASQGKLLRMFVPAEALAAGHSDEDRKARKIKDKNYYMNLIQSRGPSLSSAREKRGAAYFRQQHLTTKEQIQKALKSQKSRSHARIGETMVREKLISQEQLNEALLIQSTDRSRQFGDILIGMKAISPENLKRGLAHTLGIPFVNLAEFEFDLNAIARIPANLAHKYELMPLFCDETRIVVAMQDPLASSILQELTFATKLRIDPVMASFQDLEAAIKQYYDVPGAAKEDDITELVTEISGLMHDGGSDSESDAFATHQQVRDSDHVLVRLVNKMILDAHEKGVSDIHIESMPGNEPTNVRFRKDGVMFHYSSVPANFRNALVSRIKIMCRLDISEKRHAQDGKINFRDYGPAAIELRVLTLPTTNGQEDIVMRILAQPKAISIDEIDLAPEVMAGIKKLSERPHGLLLVCGPTGSGKTTTLHAMAGYINTPERKIYTVEDPVEITQRGLRQVQVQAKIGWGFSAILRSFMRADPDVIVVGETRDQETAKIVNEASLTGHLVFSSMHTNSAAESVVRLLDLGLDPFNFADALLGVVGQRLVRKLCEHCKKAYTPTAEELDKLAHEYCFETAIKPEDILADWFKRYGGSDETIKLYSPVGCAQCSETGFKGRMGIHELLKTSAAVKKKIHSKANVADLLETAVAEGMKTLRQDGIEKILRGVTDWDQIRAI